MGIFDWFRRASTPRRPDRYSDRARAAVALANQKALEQGVPEILPQHLLAALVEKKDGVGIALLRFANVHVGDLQPSEVVLRKAEVQAELQVKLPLASSMERVVGRAIDAAARLGDNYVGTEHLMIGLADAEVPALAAALAAAGMTARKLGDFLFVYRHIGAAFAAHGEGKWREASAIYRRILSVVPKYRSAANNLAWLLATCPEDSIRSGEEALKLMQWVETETAAQRWNHVGTLAAAYAECGRFEEAKKWGNLARDLASGEDAAGWVKRLDGFAEGRSVREGAPAKLAQAKG